MRKFIGKFNENFNNERMCLLKDANTLQENNDRTKRATNSSLRYDHYLQHVVSLTQMNLEQKFNLINFCLGNIYC